jgi:hypothetical protein
VVSFQDGRDALPTSASRIAGCNRCGFCLDGFDFGSEHASAARGDRMNNASER